MKEFFIKNWKNFVIGCGLVFGFVCTLLAQIFSRPEKVERTINEELKKAEKAKNETDNIIQHTGYLDFADDGTLKRNPESRQYRKN